MYNCEYKNSMWSMIWLFDFKENMETWFVIDISIQSNKFWII